MKRWNLVLPSDTCLFHGSSSPRERCSDSFTFTRVYVLCKTGRLLKCLPIFYGSTLLFQTVYQYICVVTQLFCFTVTPQLDYTRCSSLSRLLITLCHTGWPLCYHRCFHFCFCGNMFGTSFFVQVIILLRLRLPFIG